jgi:hypothetical protein
MPNRLLQIEYRIRLLVVVALHENAIVNASTLKIEYKFYPAQSCGPRDHFIIGMNIHCIPFVRIRPTEAALMVTLH